MLSSRSITMILLKYWCVQTIQRAEKTLIHCTTPYQLGQRLEVILKRKSDFSINKRYKFSFHFFLNKVFTLVHRGVGSESCEFMNFISCLPCSLLWSCSCMIATGVNKTQKRRWGPLLFFRFVLNKTANRKRKKK